MSQVETQIDNRVTIENITLPGTDLPKVKLININNVFYRCEREDGQKTTSTFSKEELEHLIKQALSTPSESQVIVNVKETEVECPDKKRERELAEQQATWPIYRPDSTQSIIESLTEFREIEEPIPEPPVQTEFQSSSNSRTHISGEQGNQKKEIYLGEPKYILTKVTKYITKRVHTEKTCRCY